MLDTGFRLEISGRSADPHLAELEIWLYHLWPVDFDRVRDLFRQRFGSSADLTDAPQRAIHNARTALKAAQGAFARYLIDQAMEQRRAQAPIHSIPDENDAWWLQLEELSRQVKRKGPEKR